MKSTPLSTGRDGGRSDQPTRSVLCVSTAIHSLPFRIGLITRCDVLNADEIERFHAFAYKCAWVVIEGENVTGYVIT